jgi:hypothetical protein
MAAFHGQGGHATSHFKRWKSTPVQPDTSREDEAKARNQLNRVDPELCDRSGSSNHWADYRVSVVRHQNILARYFFDSWHLYFYFNRSLLRIATAV